VTVHSTTVRQLNVYLRFFEIEGDDLNAQEVGDALLSRLDSEVEVEELVECDGDRGLEVDEHTSHLTL